MKGTEANSKKKCVIEVAASLILAAGALGYLGVVVAVISEYNADKQEARLESELGGLSYCEGNHPRDCSNQIEDVMVILPGSTPWRKSKKDSIFLGIEGYSSWNFVEILDNKVVDSGRFSELGLSDER